MLKDTRVTLTMRNGIDNISTTKVFENIKFTNHKDATVEFQVPPYLSNVHVKLETAIWNVTQQKLQNFTSEKTIYNSNIENEL